MSNHPSETTLMAYVAGSLSPAHRLVISIHIATCPDCAADSHALEAVGGALLQDLPPAALSEGSLARMLARLDEPAPPPRKERRVPTTIEELATGRWQWSGPGIAMMKLRPRDHTNTRLDLIRVAPGTALLEHGHTGFETTVVLQGAFNDGTRSYNVGDFGEAYGGIDHRPEALPGPDCVCLIATSAHLRPHSLLGRIVRPLIGM